MAGPRSTAPGRDEGTPELRARRAEAVGAENAAAWDGTIAGGLVLLGSIDRRQHAALRAFRRDWHRLRSLLPDKPRDLDWKPSTGRSVDADGAALIAARKAYDAAYAAMATHGCQRAVARVMRDEPVEDLAALRAGLDRLAAHYRLGRGRNFL